MPYREETFVHNGVRYRLRGDVVGAREQFLDAKLAFEAMERRNPGDSDFNYGQLINSQGARITTMRNGLNKECVIEYPPEAGGGRLYAKAPNQLDAHFFWVSYDLIDERTYHHSFTGQHLFGQYADIPDNELRAMCETGATDHTFDYAQKESDLEPTRVHSGEGLREADYTENFDAFSGEGSVYCVEKFYGGSLDGVSCEDAYRGSIGDRYLTSSFLFDGNALRSWNWELHGVHINCDPDMGDYTAELICGANFETAVANTSGDSGVYGARVTDYLLHPPREFKTHLGYEADILTGGEWVGSLFGGGVGDDNDYLIFYEERDVSDSSNPTTWYASVNNEETWEIVTEPENCSIRFYITTAKRYTAQNRTIFLWGEQITYDYEDGSGRTEWNYNVYTIEGSSHTHLVKTYHSGNDEEGVYGHVIEDEEGQEYYANGLFRLLTDDKMITCDLRA